MTRVLLQTLTSLGNDENVVAATERVFEDGGRSQEDVRVVTFSLTG